MRVYCGAGWLPLVKLYFLVQLGESAIWKKDLLLTERVTVTQIILSQPSV